VSFAPGLCDMPDLSDLIDAGQLMAGIVLHTFTGPRGATEREASYRKNLARLVDKAVREYQEAREACEQLVFSRGVRDAVIFCDHMENCINAVHRAIRLLDRIKQANNIGRNLNRTLKRKIAAGSRFIENIRDTFEHIDERIQRDQIPAGELIMIGLAGATNDRIRVAGEELRLDDLAQTIRTLRELGRVLVKI